MINIGKWRWPLIILLPLMTAAALIAAHVVRMNFEEQAILSYAGDSATMDEQVKMFRFHPVLGSAVFDAVPGQPHHLVVRVDGAWPTAVIGQAARVAQASIDRSGTKQKQELLRLAERDQKKITDLESLSKSLSEDRKTLLAGPRRNTPKAEVIAKIEELKSRRQQLIESYPSHSDIPLLAKQIQDLTHQLNKPASAALEKIIDLDRQINETKVQSDYYNRRLTEIGKKQHELKPLWSLVQPVAKVKWPNRVDGWPMGAAIVFGVFGLALFLFNKRSLPRTTVSANGLWQPEAAATPEIPNVSEVAEAPAVTETPVALEVVSPELPSGPMTEKAAALYSRWVAMARILYTPASVAPQGVLDQVSPLLQESSEFLPEGHDVMARYLAHSVTPGDLAAHVARTVLMTLTGAQEAGVSPEHRLAMALAALFHDLAVVPRPAAAQDDVGSDVGRLSASVLRRIPGLPQALLAMVEDILIGMDEFKLDTWQNVASGKNLEPLSKVLREIDRFEKLMQKQKARLDRRVANS